MMKLFEVKETTETDALNDPAANKFAQAEKTDTRRPRLTLEHLSKLRKMREIRKLELDARSSSYSKIYSRQQPQ